VQLGPSLLSGDGSARGVRTLSWRSIGGLARGTLLRCRLSEPLEQSLVPSLDSLTLGSDPSGDAVPVASTPAASIPTADAATRRLAAALHSVDTIDGVAFDPSNGSKLSTSLIDLTVPLTPLPGLQPASAPHELYMIIDTSGSTGMRVHSASLGGHVARLDTSKHLLSRILSALPAHLAALRTNGLINAAPVRVRMWNFDATTTPLADVLLPVDADGADLVAQLQAQVSRLRPGAHPHPPSHPFTSPLTSSTLTPIDSHLKTL
jgi:hypothetical protein